MGVHIARRSTQSRKKIRSRGVVIAAAGTLALTLGAGTAFATDDYSDAKFYTINSLDYWNQSLIAVPPQPTFPQAWSYAVADGNTVPIGNARVKTQVLGSFNADGSSPWICGESVYYTNSTSIPPNYYIQATHYTNCPFDYIWGRGITSGKRQDGTWRNEYTWNTDRILR